MTLTQPVRAPEPAGDGIAAPIGRTGRVASLPLVVGVVIGGWTLFHLWYIAGAWLDFAPDEAQYWLWSRHLDWSYYSKGPMVAYLIAISTRLGRDTEFFVRLPAVLLGVATCGFAYALTRRVFRRERVAVLVLLAYAACPLFAAGSALMTTDVPLTFFWVLAVFALANAVDAAGWRGWAWWLACGTSVGLGLLSKYTMAFFFVAGAAYLLISPRRRAQLASPAPYAAIVLSLVLFLPVVIWNASHHFVSLRHVATLAGLQTPGSGLDRLSLRFFAEFVGGQLGVVSPLLLCAAAAAAGRSAWLGVRRGSDAHLLVACFSLPLLLFFLLWSVGDRIEANWPAPAYATALIAAAAWWDERFAQAPTTERRRLRNGLAAALLLGLLITAAAHFSALLPAVGIRLPPRLDPTDRLRGWSELGQRVGRFLEQAGTPAPFLMAPSYQLASELAFYTDGHPRVYDINLGRRMSQFDIWGGLDERRGQNAVFVTYGNPPAESLLSICERPRQLDVLRILRAEQPIETFSIYACDGFKGAPRLDMPPTY